MVPRDIDGGQNLKCRARSPVIEHHPLEDKWKLEIYCKFLVLSLDL